MTWQSVYREQRKARKEYDCNSCEHLFEVVISGEFDGMNDVQIERFNKLYEAKGKIQKGDLYWHETIKFDGELHVVRYLDSAHQLCIQLDCYPKL